MFQAPLTPKIRFQSGLCHWWGLLWWPIGYGLWVGEVWPEDWRLFGTAGLGLLLATICQWLWWSGCRAQHPWIDRCGQAAVNFGFSTTVFAAGLGLLAKLLGAWHGETGLFLLLGLGGLVCLHGLVVISIGLTAMGGYTYPYPWNLPWIRPHR